MDIINIGNDIRVDFKLKNVTYAEQKDIKYIKCYFIKCACDNVKKCFSCINNNPFPQYYNPTEYTTHNCGVCTYNTIPCNRCHNHCNYEFCANSHNLCYKHLCSTNRACGCNIPNGWNTNQKLSVYFHGHQLLELGIYRLIVCVALLEKNWGCNNTHEYLIDYGTVFQLDLHNGSSGNIVINLLGSDDTDDNPDTPITPDDPDNVTDFWYVGQITKTKAQFTDLQDFELIENATQVPTTTKSKTMSVNNSCWYVLIPHYVDVDSALYTCESITSVFTKEDIVDRIEFDVFHEDIIINGKVYKVYAYRSYAFTNTPVTSIFNIK